MKTASFLTALLLALTFVGCKARDSRAPAPDPAAEAANQLHNELARLQTNTDQLSKDNSELRKAMLALADHSKSTKELEGQLAQANKAVADLQAANTRLNTTLKDSEDQLNQTTDDLKKIGQQAKADQADLAAKAEQMQTNNRLLARQNDRLKDKLDALRDKLDNVPDEMDRLTDELEKAQAITDAIQNENSQLISALQQRSDWWGGWVGEVDRRHRRHFDPGGVKEIIVSPVPPFGQGGTVGVTPPKPPVVINVPGGNVPGGNRNNGGVKQVVIPQPIPFGQGGPAMVNQPKPPVIINTNPPGHTPLKSVHDTYYHVKPPGSPAGPATGDKDAPTGATTPPDVKATSPGKTLKTSDDKSTTDDVGPGGDRRTTGHTTGTHGHDDFKGSSSGDAPSKGDRSSGRSTDRDSDSKTARPDRSAPDHTPPSHTDSDTSATNAPPADSGGGSGKPAKGGK